MPRLVRPIGLLALSTATLMATTGSSLARDNAALHVAGTAQAASHTGIRTTATECGRGNGANSNVHGQDCLEVTAFGFLGDEQVLVRELRRPGWQLTVRADGAGRVRYRLATSRRPRPDVLTFVGLGMSPATVGASGTVQVSVPRIAVYRFCGSSPTR